MRWRALSVVGCLFCGVLQAGALVIYSQPKFLVSNHSILMHVPDSSDEFSVQQGGLGVCISGGGSRSMALARGQMAVLRKYGIEERIKYLSLVSGGAWFGVSYYGSDLADRNILGELVQNPEDLSLEPGREEVSSSAECHRGCEGGDDGGGVPAVKSNLHTLDDDSLGHAHKAFSNLPGFVATFLMGTLSRGLDGSHVWSDFLNQALSGRFDKPMNTQFFHRKREDMSIIINALLKKGEQYYPFEVLADRVRVRSFEDGFQADYKKHSEFGLLTLNEKDEEQISPMRVQDVLAATSANYANFVWSLLTYFLLPEYKFAQDHPGLSLSDNPSYQLIDSGFIDYLGIMPLLARRSDRIIALVNTDIAITSKLGQHNSVVVGLEKALPALFGVQPDERAQEGGYILLKDSVKKEQFKALARGQVFESTQYEWLAAQLLEKKKAGEPTVVLQKGLTVLRNDYHAVSGGHTVDVLWVYNDLPWQWWDRLDKSIKDCLEGNRFGNWFRGCYSTHTQFPHFSAIMDLHLPAFQANLLFHLASWMLEEAERKQQVLSAFLESTDPEE